MVQAVVQSLKEVPETKEDKIQSLAFTTLPPGLPLISPRWLSQAIVIESIWTNDFKCSACNF